jgi:hypothetical protein
MAFFRAVSVPENGRSNPFGTSVGTVHEMNIDCDPMHILRPFGAPFRKIF